MPKLKIKISDEIYDRLASYPDGVKKMCEHIIATNYKKMQRPKKGARKQFDKTTLNGLIQRAYYYHNKKYFNNALDKEEWTEKWSNDTELQRIFDQYVQMDFDKVYAPTFVYDSKEKEVWVTEYIRRTEARIDNSD